MAGAFGFDAGNLRCVGRGGRTGAAAARCATADSDTLVLANGFSCREQIEQGTGRKTLHAAELAARCLGVTA